MANLQPMDHVYLRTNMTAAKQNIINLIKTWEFCYYYYLVIKLQGSQLQALQLAILWTYQNCDKDGRQRAPGEIKRAQFFFLSQYESQHI